MSNLLRNAARQNEQKKPGAFVSKKHTISPVIMRQNWGQTKLYMPLSKKSIQLSFMNLTLCGIPSTLEFRLHFDQLNDSRHAILLLPFELQAKVELHKFLARSKAYR